MPPDQIKERRVEILMTDNLVKEIDTFTKNESIGSRSETIRQAIVEFIARRKRKYGNKTDNQK